MQPGTNDERRTAHIARLKSELTTWTGESSTERERERIKTITLELSELLKFQEAKPKY
jgi:hypothetical protein